MKIFLIISVLLFSSLPVSADGKALCDTNHLVYQIHSKVADKNKYALLIDIIDNSKAIEPDVKFTLQMFTNKGELVTSLEMKYGCDGTGATSCRTGFSTETNNKNGEEIFRQFEVIALNKDMTEDLRSISDKHGPQYLILSGLRKGLHYTNWSVKKRDIQYLTAERLNPTPSSNVWKRMNCKTE